MVDPFQSMPDWSQHILFPLVRWLHIVFTTALVGGVLFYEFVIPKAIEELKGETQLAVLGRVRWIFRRIVVWSAVVLIVTGVISTWRQWGAYTPRFVRPWWALHVGLGVIAMALAVRITLGDRVPRHPIRWLRVDLVILLVAMFAAAVTRHVRLTIQEQVARNRPAIMMPVENP